MPTSLEGEDLSQNNDLIPFVSDDPLRQIAMTIICKQHYSKDEASVRNLTELLNTLDHGMSSSNLSSFITDTRNKDLVERSIVNVFCNQYIFHSQRVGKEYESIRGIIEDIKNKKEMPHNITDIFWAHVVSFLGHVGLAHNIVMPDDEQVKLKFRNEKIGAEEKRRRLRHRNYRMRLVRRALGFSSEDSRYKNWLKAIYDLRNAQAHFDESLDEAVVDFIIDAKGNFVDRCFVGLTHDWPPPGSKVLRSYNVNEDRLSYLGRTTVKLDNVVTFLRAHENSYWLNVKVGPAPYGHPFRITEFADDFNIA